MSRTYLVGRGSPGSPLRKGCHSFHTGSHFSSSARKSYRISSVSSATARFYRGRAGPPRHATENTRHRRRRRALARPCASGAPPRARSRSSPRWTRGTPDPTRGPIDSSLRTSPPDTARDPHVKGHVLARHRGVCAHRITGPRAQRPHRGTLGRDRGPDIGVIERREDRGNVGRRVRAHLDRDDPLARGGDAPGRDRAARRGGVRAPARSTSPSGTTAAATSPASTRARRAATSEGSTSTTRSSRRRATWAPTLTSRTTTVAPARAHRASGPPVQSGQPRLPGGQVGGDHEFGVLFEGQLRGLVDDGVALPRDQGDAKRGAEEFGIGRPRRRRRRAPVTGTTTTSPSRVGAWASSAARNASATRVARARETVSSRAPNRRFMHLACHRGRPRVRHPPTLARRAGAAAPQSAA